MWDACNTRSRYGGSGGRVLRLASHTAVGIFSEYTRRTVKRIRETTGFGKNEEKTRLVVRQLYVLIRITFLFFSCVGFEFGPRSITIILFSGRGL